MNRYTALLDANILYPAPVRDIFLELAVSGFFRAKWTEDIHREWIEALLRNEPWRDRSKLERTRDKMNEEAWDSLIAGYEALIPSLQLPDPDDRHVLAAAIVGRCDAIVTYNLKDFPEATLAPYGIETQHPDTFLSNQFNLSPGPFCDAIRTIRARLKNPPYSAKKYLSTLKKQELVATAKQLESYIESI